MDTEKPKKEKNKMVNFGKQLIVKIKNYFLNLNKNQLGNLISIIISLVALPLFFYIPDLRVIIGGIYLIILGLVYLLLIKKDYYQILGGSSLLWMGIFLLNSRFNNSWGLAILLAMFIFCIILIALKKTIVGLIFLALFTIASFKIIPLFGSDILKAVFLNESPPSLIPTYILGVIFLGSSIYLFLKYLLSYLSNLTKIKNICNKLNNPYLLFSITLICLISLGGIGVMRENYVNDYPLNISFEDNDYQISQNFMCNSKSGYLYFVDMDKIICKPQGFLFNYSYLKLIVNVKNERDTQWIQYNTSLFYTDIKENLVDDFRITLSKEFEEYNLFLIYQEDSSKINIILNSYLRLDISSKKDYNDQIEKRVGSLVAIFSIVLFSVFSAMANLKKILDRTQ